MITLTLLDFILIMFATMIGDTTVVIFLGRKLLGSWLWSKPEPHSFNIDGSGISLRLSWDTITSLISIKGDKNG
jgi:hypothetical protein